MLHFPISKEYALINGLQYINGLQSIMVGFLGESIRTVQFDYNYEL